MLIMEASLVCKKLCQLLLRSTLENSKLITQVVHRVLLENHHLSKNNKNNQCLANQLKEQDLLLKRRTPMMVHGVSVMNLLNIKLLLWRLIPHLIQGHPSNPQHIK
jgi:hypothetical protein